jgi:hypothetical protein
VQSSGSVRGGTSVVVAGTTVTLAAGDLTALPSSSIYELRNDGTLPASLIVVAISLPDAPQRASYRQNTAAYLAGTPLPTGVATERLAGGFVTDIPPGPAAGKIGQITLGPGGRLSEFTAPGPLLIAIESGTVDVEPPGSSAWIRDGSIGTTQITASASLSEGDGALIPTGRAITLSNPVQTPAVITLVTIAPNS